MPFYCEAQYYARDEVPLRYADDWFLNCEMVVCGEKVVEEQADADKWCNAWMRTFRVLDWCGHSGYIFRARKRKHEDADNDESDTRSDTPVAAHVQQVQQWEPDNE